MTREILFKAKRIDNGEWVQGYFINIAKINAFICTGKIKLDEALKGIIAPEMYAVDISTLCQYTGLTDKSGNRIWENDILFGYLDDNYPDDVTYNHVLWDNNGFYLKENGFVDIFLINETDREVFEVCGNIFDNPELLEVER